MPQSHLHVTLIRHTLDPQELCALGARLCYSKATVDDLHQKVSQTDQGQFINSLMEMGHFSVMEHASFTFGIEGVSRILLAQLTRHRIASFSVQSQRYVSYEKGFGYIIPPRIEQMGDEAVEEYRQQMDTLSHWYAAWQQKLGGAGEGANEDARFVLPGACETRLMVTMNVRELNHFFSLRMCRRAQWEIQALAREMHRQCLQVAPQLFRLSGPDCLRGGCGQGAKTCGQMAEIMKEREALLTQIEG